MPWKLIFLLLAAAIALGLMDLPPKHKRILLPKDPDAWICVPQAQPTCVPNEILQQWMLADGPRDYPTDDQDLH